MSGITSFAWVDDAALAVGRPSADSTQFALFVLKDGSEGTVWNIPFDARIEGWVLGQLLISARRPITEEKAQEDGSWTILDELPIWEDGEDTVPKSGVSFFFVPTAASLYVFL